MDPAAYFHIVSKDTGFDPLIESLESRNVRAYRHGDYSSLISKAISSPLTPRQVLSDANGNVGVTSASLAPTFSTMKNYEACIAALDAERDGDWEKAHQLIGALKTPEAAWVHAYLHRVEGDLGNAAHWYAQADKPTCQDSLEMEWEAIRTSLSAGA